jgi:hypothetical protein
MKLLSMSQYNSQPNAIIVILDDHVETCSPGNSKNKCRISGPVLSTMTDSLRLAYSPLAKCLGELTILRFHPMVFRGISSSHHDVLIFVARLSPRQMQGNRFLKQAWSSLHDEQQKIIRDAILLDGIISYGLLVKFWCGPNARMHSSRVVNFEP